jgi:Spy/CpxP family protein refolding chaperone
MKKVLVGFALSFALLISASQYSFAQMCGPAGGGLPQMRHDEIGIRYKGHHLWRLLASLGLDEKQKEAIKEIKSRVAKDTVRKRADLEVAGIELRDILDKDQVDMAAAEATVKKMASLQADIRLSHIKAMQEIKAKLTPEQRKKIKEMREMGPLTKRMTHDGRGVTGPGSEKNDRTERNAEQ